MSTASSETLPATGEPTPGPAAPLPATTFTPYQKLIVAILAFLQFTIVLDFMILAPLGAFLMRDLHLSTARFGLVVSAYALSAGVSGFLSAAFADRFDRKRLLLFFYAGFLGGTLLCGVAESYHALLMARMVTGVFAGVIGSIVLAIVADLFPFHMRGRVMGVVQTSFSASQVLGLPLGLYLTNHWNWHAPFLMIFGLAAAAGVVMAIAVRPIDAHLKLQRQESPLRHLVRTVARRRYLPAFAATTLLVTGGYMLMPYSTAFMMNNLRVPAGSLQHVYMVTGLCSLVAGPLLGRVSDSWGKYRLFCAGSALAVVMILIYTHLGPTPLWQVTAISSVLFVGITSRMITASALMSAVPEPASRGAFMAVYSALAQVAGAVASFVAGLIVVQTASGTLARYDALGYVVITTITLSVGLLYWINQMVNPNAAAKAR
jgi:predicted MFS family arabinose efflux permease